MGYNFLADGLVVIHLGFILFAVCGAFLALRWPKLAWLHLPCLLWAIYIELSGGICPLTPLENQFRILAEQDGYSGGFIDNYIIPIIYPPGLTRTMQIVLGTILILGNFTIYSLLILRASRKPRSNVLK